MGAGFEGGASDALVAVGLVGGTGALGRGLARRLAAAGCQVLLGSRDVGRARAAAAELSGTVTGVGNEQACAADLVVVAVPWAAHHETLTALRDAIGDRIVVDCVNPLGFDARGPFALEVSEGSACQQAQQLLPAARVVGAFHHVSASTLASDQVLDADVMVIGDDDEAVERVIELVDRVAGLYGVYAGRLRNARQVEALTANLIAVNRRYRVSSGVQITGWRRTSHS